MTRTPPPLPGMPLTADEVVEAQFSETLWFKVGALELDERGDPTPLPVPLEERYATRDPLSLTDRQQFSLHSHVPPPPIPQRRATSFAEPYDDDDLEQYAVPRWREWFAARRVSALAVVAMLAVAATATFAMTGGPSRPDAREAAVAEPSAIVSDDAPSKAVANHAAPIDALTTPAAEQPAARHHLRSDNAATAKQRRAKAKRAKAKRAKQRRAKAKRAKAKRAKQRRRAKAKRAKRRKRVKRKPG